MPVRLNLIDGRRRSRSRRERAIVVLVSLVVFVLVGVSGVSAEVGRRSITTLPTSHKVIALTFDDGPDPRFTQSVLDILAAEQVPATFFLIGEKVVADGGVTDYTGHVVGYHTYSHPQMPSLTSAQQIAEYERGAAAHPATHDTGSGYWRPPRGESSPLTTVWASQRGTHLMWSVCYDKLIREDPVGAEPRGRVFARNERIARFVSAVRPGDVVLMHDGNSNGRYLVEDLRDIIRALKREGYRFTTPEEYFGVADDRTFAR